MELARGIVVVNHYDLARSGLERRQPDQRGTNDAVNICGTP
jgi:hypothetical protein